jgi:SAM-dependent methyltransferase
MNVTAKTELQNDAAAQHLAQTAKGFSAFVDIHSTNPSSSTYWGDRYYNPLMLEGCGAGSAQQLQINCISDLVKKLDRPLRIVSIGSGDCAIEMAVCQGLINRGIQSLRFECVDIAEGAIDRAVEAAANLGLSPWFQFHKGTYDELISRPADAVIANQCLHHFTELEDLFDKIKLAIGANGILLTSDIVGRNGHMLWEEALSIVDSLWTRLPDKYKYNHCLSRFEPIYSNWDNSKEMNEGIRAQDILPGLIDRFKFSHFFAGGNISFAIFGRHFGDNFDPSDVEDREWIDLISNIDNNLINIGYLKPVLMNACMSNNEKKLRCYRHWTPEFCVRTKSPILVEGEASFALGESIVISEREPGVICLQEGWSSVEPSGVWSNAARSTISIPLASSVKNKRLKITLVGMQYRPEGFEVGAVKLFVRDKLIGTSKFGSHLTGDLTAATFAVGSVTGDSLDVDLSYETPIVPHDLGINGERRMLGFRLVFLEVNEY